MAKMLDVYLHQHLSGHLAQHDGQLRFHYADSWLANPQAIPLSHSLPLRKESFPHRFCEGFFGGILPEQDQRRVIARNLGISARNDFSLLEQIGGECAGAVTFVPAGAGLPERVYRYRKLTSHELAEILRKLPSRPLLAGEEGVRLSLAGAQDKIAIHLSGDIFSLPLGGAPSTHIIKPAIERFQGTIFNEALCLKLASKIGLPAVRAEIGSIEGIDYLLIERYDRRAVQPSSGPHSLERLHQEDFCQALGITSENKYQNEGGPSLKSCFDLLRDVSSTPVIDLQHLLDAVTFNFLVGNNDAHGKNFSLLYHEKHDSQEPVTRLAPFYDLLSTTYYPELSNKMAMKIGGEYIADKIRAKHFERFTEEAGLAKPIVLRRVTELAEAILSELAQMAGEDPVTANISKFICARCEQKLQKLIPK